MPAPSSHAPAATHTARGRLVWVDVARGLAPVSYTHLTLPTTPYV